MSLRRDAAWFFAAALVPAAAVGWLGLRALRNEEAALRREAALEVSGEAERARRSFDDAIDAAERGLTGVGDGQARLDDQASIDRTLSALVAVAPPFAEPAVLASDGRLLAPRRRTEPDRGASDAACRAATDALTGSDAVAARKTLLGCPDVRDGSGRWIWPVIAIQALRGDADPALAEELATFYEARAGSMRREERAAAREEVAALRGLPPGVADRVGRTLDAADAGGASATGDGAALANIWRSDAALRALVPGEGVRRFEGSGFVGLVRPAGDGVYVGIVATPQSVERALTSRAPFVIPRPDLTLDVVSSPPPAGSDVVEGAAFVTDGLGFRARLADPGALEARSTRSGRLLGALIAGSATIAVSLAVLLFLRMRAARRTSELRTSFVASVSHELRTPIASVRMLSELLAQGRVDDEAERAEVADALAREAKRMGDTVDRFLNYARMEKGKLQARKSAEDVASLVEERVRAFEMRHPGVEVELSSCPGLKAEVDRGQIELVVDNLLENAKKYAPNGTPYAVTLRNDGGDVVFSVADRGPGVARRLRSAIFRPFERGNARLSSATEGTGLGLALVRAAAEAHGGTAVVEEHPGPGATFTVRIPRGILEGAT
jgi:two-component system phosphate regulon sensor histidine kinase PhoR